MRDKFSLPFWEGSFLGGLSLRRHQHHAGWVQELVFPFLFGGTFIEANKQKENQYLQKIISSLSSGDFHRGFSSFFGAEVLLDYFPSFWEGLLLRHEGRDLDGLDGLRFPSFSKGLSIRQINIPPDDRGTVCSVPRGVDFH